METLFIAELGAGFVIKMFSGATYTITGQFRIVERAIEVEVIQHATMEPRWVDLGYIERNFVSIEKEN